MTPYWKLRYNNEISPVTVDRATDKSVWVKGRRVALSSDWESYHKSWEEAHKALLRNAETSLKCWQGKLTQAEAHLAAVRAMKKPDKES